MKIDKKQKESALTVCLTGRLDTGTAPNLQTDMENSFSGLTSIKIDMSGVDYVSSAGLRVFLWIHKNCIKNNIDFEVFGCNEMVKDIFEMTGFTDVFNIQ